VRSCYNMVTSLLGKHTVPLISIDVKTKATAAYAYGITKSEGRAFTGNAAK
jgi:hypothetical protein